MNTERRPFAPPDDPDEPQQLDLFDDMPADKELDFNEEPDRDLYDERDLEEDEDEFAYDLDVQE